MWQLGEQNGEDKSESVKTIDQAVDRILYQHYTPQLLYWTFKTESRLKVEVQWKVVTCGISPNTFQSKVFSVSIQWLPLILTSGIPIDLFQHLNREGQPTREFIGASILYLYITHSGSQMISLKQFLKDFNWQCIPIVKASEGFLVLTNLFKQNKYKACSKSQSCQSRVDLNLKAKLPSIM